MRNSIIIILFILLSPLLMHGQLLKNLRCEFEAGIGFSIGPSYLEKIQSTINPVSFEYYSSKRYELPTLRVRSHAYKSINDIFSVGLKAGIDIHYLEKNGNNQYETQFFVPFQITGTIKALKLNDNKSIYTDIGFGYNLKNLNYFLLKEKGGVLASVEISINKNPHSGNCLYYKAGFEYAEDNCSQFLIAPNNNYKYEVIRTIQQRKQIYIALGVNL